MDIAISPTRPDADTLVLAMPKGTPDRLPVIEGAPPSVGARPEGCAFHPRCPLATEVCRTQPPMETQAPGHEAACWHTAREAAA